MAENDKELPADQQETIVSKAPEVEKPKPKTKAKPKTKTAAKTKSAAKPKTKTKAKTKTKTAAAAKPAEKPAAPPPPPAETPAAGSTLLGGDNKKLLLIGGIIIAGGALAVLVLALVIFGVFGGGGKHIIIGYADNDWNFDIFMVEPGEDEDDGVVLAEEAEYAGTTFYVVQDGQLAKRIEGVGFVPDSSQIYLSYVDDDEIILEQMQVKDDETTDLFDTKDQVGAYVFSDDERAFFIEYQDDGVRCYLADYGEEADRIDKGTDCWPSLDGRYMMIIEQDDEETTFTLFDLKKDDDEEVLSADDIDYYDFSYDLDMIAYVVNSDDDEQELHLYNIGDEEDEEIETDFAIPDMGFTRLGDLYYVVEDDDGNMEAFVYGTDDAIAEGEIMTIEDSVEGDYLIIISGDDVDDLTVYSYDVKREKTEDLMDGEDLEVAIANDPAQLFIAEYVDGDLVLSACDLDGKNMVEIYDESDVEDYDIWYINGHEFFYIMIETEDGENLYAYEPGNEDLFTLLEEWFYIDLLNVSSDGRYLVAGAAEDDGDDVMLVSIELNEDAEMYELDDDAEDIYNAVFMANDKEVIYTAINGDENDDVSVNLVPVDGDDKPDELHDEAVLLDVEWGILYPFDSLSFSWLMYGQGN